MDLLNEGEVTLTHLGGRLLLRMFDMFTGQFLPTMKEDVGK